MTTSVKKLGLLALSLAGVLSSVGCDTPGYSSRQRGQQIARNWDMEWKMLQDDVDNALLLRPMTMLSKWNIR